MKIISFRVMSRVILVAGFWLGTTVVEARVNYVGDPRYQPIDAASLQTLRTLLNQKKINQEEFNRRLTMLAHPVQAIDLNAGLAAGSIVLPAQAPSVIPSDNRPNRPFPLSPSSAFVDYRSLASTSPVGGTGPVVSTGTVTSTGTLPAPVSTSTASGFVYTKIFTALTIQIKDEGYGMSAAEKARLISYLDRLPAEQLAGLQEIILRPDLAGPGNTIDQHGKQITINRTRNSDPGAESILIGDLAQGIGRYVYDNSPEIRSTWQALPMPYRLGGGSGTVVNFAMEYAAYTSGSLDQMAWAVNDPDKKLLGLTTCLPAASGAESCRTVQPEPEKDVPAILVLASLFAHQGTANVNTYSMTSNGDTRLDYSSALRNNEWLVVGGYSFRLDNGQIVGWSTGNVFDILNAAPKYDANGQQVLQAILSRNFTSPIDVPPMVLSHIVK